MKKSMPTASILIFPYNCQKRQTHRFKNTFNGLLTHKDTDYKDLSYNNSRNIGLLCVDISVKIDKIDTHNRHFYYLCKNLR